MTAAMKLKDTWLLMLSQRSLKLVLISFRSFFLTLFCSSDFHHSVFQLIHPFFCLSFSARISSSVFINFSYCFISVCSLILIGLFKPLLASS